MDKYDNLSRSELILELRQRDAKDAYEEYFAKIGLQLKEKQHENPLDWTLREFINYTGPCLYKEDEPRTLTRAISFKNFFGFSDNLVSDIASLDVTLTLTGDLESYKNN